MSGEEGEEAYSVTSPLASCRVNVELVVCGAEISKWIIGPRAARNGNDTYCTCLYV